MTEEVIVRAATSDDALAIGRISVRSWRATYHEIVPAQILDRLSIERQAGGWRSEIASPENRFEVAELDGELVGFSVAGPMRPTTRPNAPRLVAEGTPMDGSAGELYAIYVDPDRLGRGVGGSLMAHAVEGLVADGYLLAILWVFERNPDARAFYEHEGWTADGAAAELDLDGTAAIELRYRRALRE